MSNSLIIMRVDIIRKKYGRPSDSTDGWAIIDCHLINRSPAMCTALNTLRQTSDSVIIHKLFILTLFNVISHNVKQMSAKLKSVNTCQKSRPTRSLASLTRCSLAVQHADTV